MILIVLLAVVLTAQQKVQPISYQEAIQSKTLINFEIRTTKNFKKHYKRAIKNKYWVEANDLLLKKRIYFVKNSFNLKTIPYHKIIALLKKASTQGVVLAMYQGYELSAKATGRVGSYAVSDLGFFAKEMMAQNMCIGYIESSYGYSRGWYASRQSWSDALEVIEAGEKQCSNTKLSSGVRNRYAKMRSQYKAMVYYEKSHD